jgi:hypothetical protein
MADVNYMSLEEFWRQGYLQEVNRQFLHPLGLALEMVVGDDGAIRLGGVWDYRDDPEGMIYDAGSPSVEKAERIVGEWSEKAATREEKFGWVVQPVEAADG